MVYFKLPPKYENVCPGTNQNVFFYFLSSQPENSILARISKMSPKMWVSLPCTAVGVAMVTAAVLQGSRSAIQKSNLTSHPPYNNTSTIRVHRETKTQLCFLWGTLNSIATIYVAEFKAFAMFRVSWSCFENVVAPTQLSNR